MYYHYYYMYYKNQATILNYKEQFFLLWLQWMQQPLITLTPVTQYGFASMLYKTK